MHKRKRENIPPQRTNQIFTPKKVVKDMVDRLERENPGCFDDPDATFADLYNEVGNVCDGDRDTALSKQAYESVVSR